MFMEFEDVVFDFEFSFSGKIIKVSLEELVNCSIYFLDNFCEEPVVTKEFRLIAGPGNGSKKLERIIEAANHKNDPGRFFSEILQKLEISNYRSALPVQINDIGVPYHLLIFILEKLIPGNGIVDIHSVKQLEEIANIKFEPEEKEDLEKIIGIYPVRFSWHTIRQMRLSWPIAFQYMPFKLELNTEGLENTWVGQFHKGIIEQMYVNRIIYILNMQCPVYCRFCFRKHKDCRNQKSPRTTDVMEALSVIRNNKDVKEIVLTGGDPFMNKATLCAAIESLLEIKHIQTLRIATRSISYFPNLFYENDYYWFKYLKKMAIQANQNGQKIEIATHFVHPDEVSLYTLDIISDFVKAGIPIYIQTPLLNNCNNGGPELVKLFSKLRGAGAEIHYIFMPCSPIKGNSVYRTSISDGHETVKYLRAYVSDRAFPHICTATSMGKIDWHTSGWAVDMDKNDDRFIWIRTPYTPEYFKSFVPELQLSDIVRKNSEGTLDLKFMASIGDEKLLKGHRKKIFNEKYFAKKIETGLKKIKEKLLKAKSLALDTQVHNQNIVFTGSQTLSRIHITRIEVECPCGSDLGYNIDYIRANEEITDVVIACKEDIISSLYDVNEIIKHLADIKHVNAIRLRSIKFLYSPEAFSKQVISKLSFLNHLSVVNPKRLEIEIQIHHASELGKKHKNLVTLLRDTGITVYNNTPLLTGINDTPEQIHAIAFKCREIGIEFNHVYLAGLPIQRKWLSKKPFNLPEIVDIASYVREFGSGRELPRYIIRTPLGEVDFGLTSETRGTKDGNVLLKLMPYDIAYYKHMKSNFRFDPNIEIDIDGCPIVPVEGLVIKKGCDMIF